MDLTKESFPPTEGNTKPNKRACCLDQNLRYGKYIFMLFIHPVVQFLDFILACYVFYLGLQRLRSLHLKQSVAFQWKRHVVLGILALGTFLAGMAGGIVMVYTYWRSYFITGLHSKVAIVLMPLILFGIFSGLYMVAYRPCGIHGSCGVVKPRNIINGLSPLLRRSRN